MTREGTWLVKHTSSFWPSNNRWWLRVETGSWPHAVTSHRHLPCVCLLEAAPPPTGSIWGRRSTLLCSLLPSSALLCLHHFGTDRKRRWSEVRHTWASFCCGCFLRRPPQICPCAKRWGKIFFLRINTTRSLKRSSTQLPLALNVNLNLFLSFFIQIGCGITE